MSDNNYRDSAHKFTAYYLQSRYEQQLRGTQGGGGGNWSFSHPEAGDPRTWLCFGAIVGAIFGPVYYSQYPFWIGMPAGAAACGVPMMVFAFVMRKTTMIIGAALRALFMLLGHVNDRLMGVPKMSWRGAKWGLGLGVITMIAQDSASSGATPIATGVSVGVLAGAGFQGIKLLASRLKGSD